MVDSAQLTFLPSSKSGDKKLGQISKIWHKKLRYCALVWESMVSCQLPL